MQTKAIYIDLMRKRCQLINVDVDVDAIAWLVSTLNWKPLYAV